MVARGKVLYGVNCAFCHCSDARGGEGGPNLLCAPLVLDTVAGSLVSPNNGGATNWPPPAYSPDTGLFHVPTNGAHAMYYLTETDPRGARGPGGGSGRCAQTGERGPPADRIVPLHGESKKTRGAQ